MLEQEGRYVSPTLESGADAGETPALRLAELRDLLVAEAIDHVIVDHAHRLHRKRHLSPI
ncbi:MAG: hypothetical protein M3O61_18020 [Gemmatimonadota bacterium]|nr:hypothetical protein [Gemmatimonadota bacterium]